MKKRIKPCISLILLMLVPVFCVIAISRHFYNSFENLFIDKCETLLDALSFSQYTTIVNILGSVGVLFLLPHFIQKVVNPEYEFSDNTYFIIKLIRRNYILVFLFVLLAIFPATLIGGGMSFGDAFAYSFLDESLFTHLLSPAFFYISTIILDRKPTEIKDTLLIFLPSVLYSILYAIMVYGVGTWNDFYFTKIIGNYLGFFTLPVLFVVLISINYLIGVIDNSVIRKINKLK